MFHEQQDKKMRCKCRGLNWEENVYKSKKEKKTVKCLLKWCKQRECAWVSECHTDSRLAGCGGAALSPCVWFLLSARWWRCVLCWFWARWLPACLNSHSTLLPPHPHHHTRWSPARFPRLTSTPPARVRVPQDVRLLCINVRLMQCFSLSSHTTLHTTPSTV